MSESHLELAVFGVCQRTENRIARALKLSSYKPMAMVIADNSTAMLLQTAYAFSNLVMHTKHSKNARKQIQGGSFN